MIKVAFPIKKEKENELLINGWENQQPSEKSKLRSLLPKINLRWINNLIIKMETIKVPEENLVWSIKKIYFRVEKIFFPLWNSIQRP